MRHFTEDEMAETSKRSFVKSFLLPGMELLVVVTLLLGFAFHGRYHLEDTNPRHDFVKLLFFACVFGGVLIMEARLHALFEKRGVFIVEKKPYSPRRLMMARLYITGYVILILSAILMVVLINL